MFDKFNTEVLCQVLCFGDQEKLELANTNIPLSSWSDSERDLYSLSIIFS